MKSSPVFFTPLARKVSLPVFIWLRQNPATCSVTESTCSKDPKHTVLTRQAYLTIISNILLLDNIFMKWKWLFHGIYCCTLPDLLNSTFAVCRSCQKRNLPSLSANQGNLPRFLLWTMKGRLPHRGSLGWRYQFASGHDQWHGPPRLWRSGSRGWLERSSQWQPAVVWKQKIRSSADR